MKQALAIPVNRDVNSEAHNTPCIDKMSRSDSSLILSAHMTKSHKCVMPFTVTESAMLKNTKRQLLLFLCIVFSFTLNAPEV